MCLVLVIIVCKEIFINVGKALYKFLNCYYLIIINGQSVERGANNAKVVCSRLIRTRLHLSFGLLSLFK